MKDFNSDFYRTLYDNAPDAVIVHGIDGKIHRVNDEARRLLHYLGLTGEGDLKRLVEIGDNQISIMNEFGSLMFTRLASSAEGIPVTVEISSRLLYLDQETMIVSIMRDISERTREATATTVREERFRTIFNNAILGIFMTDPRGYLIQFNTRMLAMFGYEKRELMGKPVNSITSPGNRDSVARRMQELFDDRTSTLRLEVVYRRKDSTDFWGELTMSPIRNQTGKAESFVGIIINVTERKNYENALLVAIQEADIARAQAEKADQAKSMFLANMSHEIRTPLNAVNGYSELLMSLVQGTRERDYLDGIKSASRTLLELINDILDLSKIEAGKLRLFKSQENLDHICQDVLRIFSMKAKEKGINLVLDPDATVPERLFLDGVRLRQILLNLVGNAIKFTDHGSIKIQTVNTGFNATDATIGIQIRITDTGIGIPRDDFQAIFKSFEQIHGQDAKYGGTGLGLAISKNLIEMMNGTISVQSIVGEGSTFTIELPAVEIMAPAETSSAKSETDLQLGKFPGLTVLIAEQDDTSRNILQELMKLMEIETIAASNALQAIDCITDKKPDLIFINLSLPFINDPRVHHFFTQENAVPLISVSASIPEPAASSSSMPFVARLAKPIEIDHLIEVLRAWCPASQPTEGGSIPSFDPTPEEASRILALLMNNQLTILHRQDNAFPMDDMRSAAQTLIEIGTSESIVSFAELGRRIRLYSETFDIAKIIRIRGSFQDIVTRLRNISGEQQA